VLHATKPASPGDFSIRRHRLARPASAGHAWLTARSRPRV